MFLVIVVYIVLVIYSVGIWIYVVSTLKCVQIQQIRDFFIFFVFQLYLKTLFAHFNISLTYTRCRVFSTTHINELCAEIIAIVCATG